MSTADGPHASESTLVQYLLGRLTAEAQAEMWAHVQNCPVCLDKLDELNALPGPLREAIAGVRMNPPDVPGFDYERDANGWAVELGRGGLGVVYLARRHGDSRLVAVKFVAGGPDAYTRFAREVGASLEARHPGIVRADSFGTASDGRLYYVMEYVAGKNLREFQAGKPFPAEAEDRWAKEVARWALALAEAMQHAHAGGFFHRDLKPANVLVELENRRPRAMKVTDFGLARRLDAPRLVTLTGQPVGTLLYSPPEQVEGRGTITAAADVYGLGAVLYFMLTGRTLFDPGLPVSAALDAVRHKDPEPPSRFNPAVPFHLETVCLKCLRKDPSDRYQSAGELAADLDRFLAGKRPQAKRQTRVDRLLRWRRRNPHAVTIILTILGLLGLSTYLFVQERSRKEEADRLWRGAETSASAARQSEARAEELAFARLLDAARKALGRGQLAAAEGLFDQAVAAASPEKRLSLEVERLRCLFAFGRWGRLRSELDRLARRDDLADALRAEVLLHQGDLSLWEVASDTQRAARDTIRAALAIPGGLRAADADFARGMLDESSFDAVRHFEGAIRHDRFHQRANAALLMELVLTGQFEAALRRAEFVAAVFPGEPVAPLAQALIATLREDTGHRERHLADLRRLVADPSRMAGLEGVFAALDDVIASNHRIHGPKNSANGLLALFTRRGVEGMFSPKDVLRFVRKEAAPFALEGVPAVVGVGLPVMGRPVRMVGEMAAAYDKLGNHDYSGAAGLLDASRRDHPESLLLLLQAVAHLGHAQTLERQGDLAGCFRETEQAHALAEQAADAPTLLPFGPYRHNAHWLCLLVEVGWQAQYRRDAAMLSAAALGAAASTFGVGPPSFAPILTAGCHRLQAYPVRKDGRHLWHIVSDRRTYDEARSDLLPPLLPLVTPDDARLLLSAWAAADPRDAAPVRLRAELELREGNLIEALRWADRGLSISANNRDLRLLRDRVNAMIEARGKKSAGTDRGTER